MHRARPEASPSASGRAGFRRGILTKPLVNLTTPANKPRSRPHRTGRDRVIFHGGSYALIRAWRGMIGGCGGNGGLLADGVPHITEPDYSSGPSMCLRWGCSPGSRPKSMLRCLRQNHAGLISMSEPPLPGRVASGIRYSAGCSQELLFSSPSHGIDFWCASSCCNSCA
jgi:hypothetical protein